MATYGVEKQKGWQAINLFFNTSATGLNSVISDESFARPGDYVMFRALKDLTIERQHVQVILMHVIHGIPRIFLLEPMTKKKNFQNHLLLEWKQTPKKNLL